MRIQDQKQKQDIGRVGSGNMKIKEVEGITEAEFEMFAAITKLKQDTKFGPQPMPLVL